MAVFVVAALAALPASAEEGMWTFDHFPTARMQTQMGWAPDQAWLDKVMAGTARLPGCSASNVSAEGLVLTNHHCVIGCALALSSAQSNYVDQGFMARARAEERRCPGMNVQVLQHIEDVTARISTATNGVPPEGFARARDAAIAQMEGGCSQGSTRCEVVTLYQGGRYALYTYRRYDDVRLVFAPEHAIASFGGDPDNFNFPRYDLDFSFLRLYENGQPARTPAHLNIRFTPLTENEIVLIAGNPGGTERLSSVAQLAFQRDYVLPWRLITGSELRGRLIAYSQQGGEQARIASSALQGTENSLKVAYGRRLALVDGASFARIQAGEADLQARVHRNVASTRAVGDAWGEIARAEDIYSGFFFQHQYLEVGAGQRSDLFGWARDIVRGAAERGKPNADRLARYSDARLGAVEQGLRAERPVDVSFEELNLAFWFSKMREYLTADDPNVKKILGRESPEGLAHRLAQSQLSDPAFRMQLWQGGESAVQASNDPMIVFVRAWDADARAVSQRYRAEVEGPIARASERIAQARFRAFGDTRYPDATFTPRLSYGRVSGWTEAGRQVASFTHFAGLYDRATGADPFALPQSWITAQSRLDANTIFDISSTNDIIGGNSGSPLLDRQGNVVGAVFDGNIHSLGGDYFYDGSTNRAVTVSATAIRAALVQVYAMDALVAELSAQ
jgi:hypothetical protein